MAYEAIICLKSQLWVMSLYVISHDISHDVSPVTYPHIHDDHPIRKMSLMSLMSTMARLRSSTTGSQET